MVNKCSAPNCKGNYQGGPKVTVFKFPKDENLKKQWIHFIKREKTFVPGPHTTLCEKHFHPDDIIRNSTAVDEKTGRVISVSLQYPRLRPGAVPSVLPECPMYLSTNKVTRESVEDRRFRLEQEQLRAALAASIVTQDEYVAKITFSGLSEFLQICEKKTDDFKHRNLHILKEENKVMFARINFGIPSIPFCAVVNEGLMLKAFRNSVEMHQIGDVLLPKKISNFNEFEDILDGITKFEEKEPDLQTLIGMSTSILSDKINIRTTHFTEMKKHK